jgi:hypothetical protein
MGVVACYGMLWRKYGGSFEASYERESPKLWYEDWRLGTRNWTSQGQRAKARDRTRTPAENSSR